MGGTGRDRSKSPQWGSTSGSRKRAASPYQSRYEKEMKKKPYRPYEAQAALIDEMLDSARKASESPRKGMQLEQQTTLTRKQRKMQAQKARKDWMSQDTLWMQDVSGVSEKKGGKKSTGASGDISVMNLNLGEEHMSMADAAAWYAKQRMMGMQQQQQQQMGQFGGMGQFGEMGMGRGSGYVGGPGGQSGLYPSLMGMMQGPGFQGGGGYQGMGRGMGMMSMGQMGQFQGGGGQYFGGPGNFGGGGGAPGRRQQKPKVSKTPKASETPIKLELRPGFITDITLADTRETSPTPESDPATPKITVDKVVDPLKDEDPIGARYWKGMPPKAATAKSKAGRFLN